MSDLFKTFKAAVALGRKHLIAAIMAEPDFDKDAALVWAGRNHATRMAEVLLVNGANADTVTPEGEPVLVEAIAKNRFGFAKLLVMCGADVNARGKGGFTALMHARKRLTVRLLVLNGADVNLQNEAGTTALMIACERNYARITKYLIANGALTDMQDKQGRTALMLAAIRGSGNAYDVLLEARAHENVQDNHGNTALMLVIRYAQGYLSLAPASVLIRYRADVNIQNHAGETALMLAMHSGDEDIIKSLLKAGADVRLTNKKGRTALDIARKLGKSGFANLLDRHLQAA